MNTPQVRQPVKSLSRELAELLLETIKGLETAIELSQEDPPEHLRACKGWMAGNALWMRALKNCEATLFLVEQGMDGPAWSNLRMGYECLFFACALWKKPSNLARLEGSLRVERGKQAGGMLKPGVHPNLSTERKQRLEKLVTAGAKAKEWKVFDAAFEVDMEYFYQMVYRGSGMMGAHATALSTDAHFEEVSEGVHSFYYGPRFDDARFQIGWIRELLVLGLKGFKESRQLDQPPSPK